MTGYDEMSETVDDYLRTTGAFDAKLEHRVTDVLEALSAAVAAARSSDPERASRWDKVILHLTVARLWIEAP